MEEYNKSEFQTTLQGRVPAPATQKFIERTEVKFDNVEKSMNELSTDIKIMKNDIQTLGQKLDQHTADQKEQFHELNTKIDGFISSADNRYAEKRIEHLFEKIIWAVGLLIVGAVATAIFKLIFK